ncbi:hypothetical protein GSF24_35720 [Microbispora triticiradicis]|nr:hypothetical protein [Microbispora triticiradicis]
MSFRLKFVRQEERKRLTILYDRRKAVKRVYAPQGFIGLLLDQIPDKSAHFLSVDLRDPFFQELQVDVVTPVDFEHIGLFATDVRIDYGDPHDHRDADFRLTALDPGPKRFTTFLDEARDLGFQVGFQHHFRADSGWAGEKLSYDIAPRRSTDRTLKADPNDDLGFLELEIFPNRIDAGAVDAVDVEVSYDDGATFQRRDVFRVRPGGAAQTWRLRLTRPDRRGWTARFTHHLRNGSVRTSGPVAGDASFLPVDDPFLDALDIRALPVFEPGAIRMAFLDVEYDDPGNGYHRSERLEIPADAQVPLRLRIALLDPAVRTFRHRVTIVTAEGHLVQGPPVDGEETLIPIGPAS